MGYWFSFDDLREGEQIEVRMGISYVSTENARRNLDAEQPAGTSFDAIRGAARTRWNDDLSRIRIEGGTDEQQTVFYTALYHCLLYTSGIAAARAGHQAVMTPNSYCYLDYCQDDPTREPAAAAAFVTLEKASSLDPAPASLGVDVVPMILGVQGNLWCEHVPTGEHAEQMCIRDRCPYNRFQRETSILKR